MKYFRLLFIALNLLVVGYASPAFADAVNDMNTANALVRDGKLDEALEIYQRIKANGALKNELTYNVAVAHYRMGDLKTAKAMFTEIAASSDIKLAPASRYNLGNCFYADALTVAEQDPKSAIELLKNAIDHYRASLAGNPRHVDARANIELAVELIEKLKQDEQKQDEQNQDEQKQDEQKQDEQKQDEQKQDEQKQDEQKQDEQKQDEQKQDEQKQDEQKQDEQKQDEQKQDEQKQDEQKQDEQKQDEQKQDEQKQDEHKKRQQQDNASQEGDNNRTEAGNSESQDRPEEQDPSPTEEQAPDSEDQSVPSGELKSANEQDLRDAKERIGGEENRSIKEGVLSKEEAFKMLQAVRDRDMLRRLRQEQIERQMRVPTERDW